MKNEKVTQTRHMTFEPANLVSFSISRIGITENEFMAVSVIWRFKRLNY